MSSNLARNLRTLTFAFAASTALIWGYRTLQEPPETCVQTSDTQAFQKKFPDLYDSFKKIEALPYSGQYVTADLKNPANGIQTCSATTLSLSTAAGDYLPASRKLRMLRGAVDARAYTHEMFHAEQDINGALRQIGSPAFTLEDNVEGNMLVEASAVGYSFIVYKEMSKTDPGAYADFAGTWYSFGMRPAFDAAYEKALPQGEQKALEAGGKAVVDGLLSGANMKWALNYAVNSAYNNTYSASPEARERPGYAQERADFYRRAGAVSPGINITPDWMLAEKPEQAITTHLKMTGVVVKYNVN